MSERVVTIGTTTKENMVTFHGIAIHIWNGTIRHQQYGSSR